MASKRTENIHINYGQQTRPYHKAIVKLVGKYAAENAFILDVGCGVGNTLTLIKDKQESNGYRFAGADIDPKCLEITNDRVNLEKSIQINDVLDLVDPNVAGNDKYDMIILAHVLEHVTRPYDTVKALMSMLKPGGHLIMAVPNPVRPDVFFFNMFRMFDKINQGHIQTWDRSHWKNFLERKLKLKLNVVEYPTDYIRVPVLDRPRFTHPFLEFLAKIFPGYARSCMAVIRNN